jgi:hypothetical protein
MSEERAGFEATLALLPQRGPRRASRLRGCWGSRRSETAGVPCPG